MGTEKAVIAKEKMRPEACSREEALLAPAMEYLRNNYSDNLLSVERLAGEVPLSCSYFRKVFKRVYGQSPRKFIIDLRIQKAKEMIRSSSNLVVGDVAKAVGFSSTFAFCRAFKDAVGCTATEYAKERETGLV